MPKNNKKNDQNLIKDEGAAVCALVFPGDRNYPKDPFDTETPDGLSGSELKDFLEKVDTGVRVLLPNCDDDPVDNSIRGLLVVNSASEKFSVREISLVPPRIKDGRLISGPRLTYTPSVRFECPNCGKKIVQERVFVAENTVREKIGKKYKTVAKDDRTKEVWKVGDLAGHELSCPLCSGLVRELPKIVYWHTSDTEVVHTKEWKDAIEKRMNEGPFLTWDEAYPEVVEASLTERGKFEVSRHLDILGAIMAEDANDTLKFNTWNQVSAGGAFGKLLMLAPEITVFSLDNAQQLSSLSFGDRENKLAYSGNIGFKPRDIRLNESQPMVSVADALVSIQVHGITI